jgi:hypothetical protein
MIYLKNVGLFGFFHVSQQKNSSQLEYYLDEVHQNKNK